MAEATNQQVLQTVDGTGIVFDSWMQDGDSVTMSPGRSRFTARCPAHGEIGSSYESLTVMFKVRDHAVDSHDGAVDSSDLLDLGPSIQLREGGQR